MPVFPWSMSDFKPGEENNRKRDVPLGCGAAMLACFLSRGDLCQSGF